MTSGDRNEHTGVAQTAPRSSDDTALMAICGEDVWTAISQVPAGKVGQVIRWDGVSRPPDGHSGVGVLLVDLTSGDPCGTLAAGLGAIRSADVLNRAAVLAVIPGDVPGMATRAVAGGADDVVTSPVDPDLLGLRISRLRGAGAAADVIAQLTEALDHANRQLGSFAYTASHDLKEPLRAVTGFARLLQTRHAEALGESGRGYLDFITDGAQRMGEMISSLLRFSRVSQQDLVLEPVDLAAIMVTILDRLRADGRPADVAVGDLPTVLTDRELASTLLDALVDNAVKFADPERANVVTVQAWTSESGWQMTVTDTGVGIPADGRERAFELFSRLHSREAYPGEGMGLGLATVIVQRLGGRIGMESEVDVGTTMTITFGEGQ